MFIPYFTVILSDFHNRMLEDNYIGTYDLVSHFRDVFLTDHGLDANLAPHELIIVNNADSRQMMNSNVVFVVSSDFNKLSVRTYKNRYGMVWEYDMSHMLISNKMHVITDLLS